MELSQRVDELEAELKIVKNEVQTVLLDIRERILSYYDNPFQVIEARSGGSKGDIDASLVGGSGDSGGASPVAQAPVEQRAAEPVTVSEAPKRAETAAETSELKALADQMHLERQAMEQERKALEQAMQATQQAAQAAAAAPPMMAAGMPTQPGMPVGQAMPAMAPAQPMMAQPMMAQPMMAQPMMGQPVQQPMQPTQMQYGPGPQAAPGEPVRHKHYHQKGDGRNYDDYDGDSRERYRVPYYDDEDETRGDDREPYYDDDRPRGSRRSSGGQGMRPSGRTAERDSSKETGDRKTGRRILTGKRRPGEGWLEHDDVEEETTEGTPVNLMTLIGLVRWVEKSIEKIGKDRVEAIVEIYRTAGFLPSSYNDTIPQIIRLAEDEKPEGVVTMGDSINVLLQLDSLLGGKFKTESAVLSTLFGDDGGYPWTKQ